MAVNWSMLPLLIVALLIWAGIIVFLFAVERKVARLEGKLDEMSNRPQDVHV